MRSDPPDQTLAHASAENVRAAILMTTEESTSGQTDYLQVNGDIPVDLADGAFVSVNRETPPKIYQLGFQPARSIPEIPRWFLRKYADASFQILDPFAGAGTTIIEGLRAGVSVFWLDYHPLSRLICQVKTADFSSSEIRQTAAQIVQGAATQKSAPQTVHFANKDFWFQKPVQEGLEIVREHIATADVHIQPVLWLAFAATVRKTSDMNDGMILAAKRAHVQAIPQRTRADVFAQFQTYVNKAAEAISEWGDTVNGARQKAVELPIHDARVLDGSPMVDAVLTSPPYINAIDYVWASKFELHWLGMVSSDEDRLTLYKKEIGTERFARKEYVELGQTGNSHLDRLIEAIYTGEKYKASKGQNALRARVVYQYFVDMQRHFASSFEHLRPGGYYCFTVGDVSRICGVDVPVADILVELAREIGFTMVSHFHLLLKNRKLNIPRNVNWAGTIKHDTAVVLRKPM